MNYFKIVSLFILNIIFLFKATSQIEEPPIGDEQGHVFVENEESSESLKKGLLRIAEHRQGMEDELVFSQESSIQFEEFDLYISSESKNSNLVIYYTLDGSIPTKLSLLYGEPISIKNPIGTVQQSYGVVVRAVGFLDDEIVTEVKSASYVFYKAEDERYQLPVISLITDSENFYNNDTGIYVRGVNYTGSQWSGNYFMTGIDWERDIHISYFDEKGVQQLEQDAGVRIHGGLQRNAAQKSLRFYARSEYGDKDFDYQLLPQKDKKEYKRFILRTGTGDWNNTFIKDAVSVDLIRGLNLEMQDYRPVITLLNGKNFGVYWIRDYLGEKHYKDKYDVEEESLTIVVGSVGAAASTGTTEEYLEMRAYIESNDLTEVEHYDYIKTKMDIYDYINYYASEIYLNNYDWPSSNNRCWKSTGYDNRWRWIFYDLDAAYNGRGGFSHNMLNQASTDGSGWPNGPGSSLILSSLLTNSSFRDEFITRSAYIAHYHFDKEKILDVIDDVKAQVLPEVSFQIEKWGNPSSVLGMNSAINSTLVGFANVRNGYVQSHYMTKFGLSGIADLTLATNEEHGQITLNDLPIPQNDNTADYYKDAIIRLQAKPNYGYKFDHWEGSVEETTESYIEIVLEEDLKLTAVFTVDESIPSVRINELKNCGDADEADWVELLNLGSNELVLSEWFLSDNKEELDKWSLSNLGTANFSEGEFLVIESNQEELIDPAKLNFKIATEETVYLSSNVSGDLTVVDKLYVEAVPCKLSFGLFDNQIIQLNPTPRATNELYSSDEEEIEQLYLNELLASNTEVNQDDFFEYEDWIELYNGGEEKIDINGLFLSDDLNDPFKYEIDLLDSELEPKDYMLLWADNDIEQGDSHLNFKLSKDGECIYLNQLSDESFVILDSICFDLQFADVSFGRKEDGELPWVYFDVPTPNKENDYTTSVNEGLDLLPSVYPNPFSSEAIIQNEFIDQVVDVQFWDASGNKVGIKWVKDKLGIQIIRDNLDEGMYVYYLLTEDDIISRGKVLIQGDN